MYRYEDNSVDRYEKDAYFVALQINESDAYFVALQIRFRNDVIENDTIFRHLFPKKRCYGRATSVSVHTDVLNMLAIFVSNSHKSLYNRKNCDCFGEIRQTLLKHEMAPNTIYTTIKHVHTHT